ncbi:hypothetical protein GCM10027610_140580 [Dactylosporangium cerinum]
MPARAGLAPLPTAELYDSTLFSTTHDTPMLLSAPPLAHTPPWPEAPPKVLPTTYTGWLWNWLSTRIAAPPRSGPFWSQRLRTKRELTTLNRPPRTKIAPPPPPSAVSPVELPSANVRFCTVSDGWSWSWQCDVVQPCFWSHVFMYRMRRRPSPLSVTLPPPSSTIFAPCTFLTFAVAFIVIVTGSGPQLNVMIPPAATADTTASEVQLPGVPLPTTLVGFDVSTARASAGTVARPPGLPLFAGGAAAALLLAFCVAGTDGATPCADPAPLAAGALDAVLSGEPPQPASARTTVISAAAAVRRRIRRSYDRAPRPGPPAASGGLAAHYLGGLGALSRAAVA